MGNAIQIREYRQLDVLMYDRIVGNDPPEDDSDPAIAYFPVNKRVTNGTINTGILLEGAQSSIQTPQKGGTAQANGDRKVGGGGEAC